MAIRYVGAHRYYIGLSTDTKPSDSDLPVGSMFEETDSGYFYRWNSSDWVRSGITETRLFVWNTDDLAWERMIQPALEAGTINVELATASLEKIMVNLHDVIQLQSRKITLLTEIMRGAIGGGAEELTLDDIEED